MPIEPKTDIYLCATPINDLNNQVNFSSLSAQYNYFRSTARHSYGSTTYIEPIDGEIDWYDTAAEIMDCNYLMFRNTAYSSKWYYAFITEIKPTNSSNSCTISFKIDPWNTFYWDFSIKECYVLREHTATDAIGDHTLPEPVDLGPMVNNLNFNNKMYSDNTAIALAVGFNTSAPGEVPGYIVQNNYTANSILIYHVDSNGASALNSKIYEILTTEGTISQVYLIPVPDNSSFSDGANIGDLLPTLFPHSENNSFSLPSALNEYIPRNNKLFTYPYCYLEITNNNGSVAEYAFEYFYNNNAKFTTNYTFSCPGKAYIHPTQGTVSSAGYSMNGYNDGVETPPFPLCAYGSDSYAQWVSEQGNAFTVSTLAGIAGTAVGIMSANPLLVAGGLSSALSTVSNLTQSYTDLKRLERRSNVVQGSGSSISSVSGNFTGFYISCKCPKYEYIKIIDDFFDRYGYSVNTVKKPEINSRPQWNYIKTQGAIVTGGIPKMFLDQICQMLDNGCTIWHNPSNVGNYSLNNKP